MEIAFDINNTLDLLKLKFYNEWLYTAHIYDEGESPFHKSLTTQITSQYIDPIKLPLDAKIIDLGCGPGYFLDEMKTRNYTDVTGITLSSPYPIFSLMEYNRILKQGSKIYIEVPAPGCARQHEQNLNHYSIFGHEQLSALLTRCGFTIDKFDNLEFDLEIPQSDGTTAPVTEHYYCIVATKTKPLDIK